MEALSEREITVGRGVSVVSDMRAAPPHSTGNGHSNKVRATQPTVGWLTTDVSCRRGLPRMSTEKAVRAVARPLLSQRVEAPW